MSTLEVPPMNRAHFETQLIEKCWKDPAFQQRLIDDPRGTIEATFGKTLPANLKICMHEENATTLHLKIPMPPSNVTELSDQELERVAGGTDFVITLLTAYAIATVAASAAVGVAGGVTTSQGW